MKSLVGYSGFVGSNIASGHNFDELYNSKNITQAFGKNPELLVYSGVPAEKYLANTNPDADMDIIHNAMNSIKKINPDYLVLISTIDVYKNPAQVDEASPTNADSHHAYGKNRYALEKMIEESAIAHTIIRLPALFGQGLKKNFIYDLIHVIPQALNEVKYSELKHLGLEKYYSLQPSGFYVCRELSRDEKMHLKEKFIDANFTALNFTDSRGIFQFYNLEYLWSHIQAAISLKIKLLNIAVEPLSVADIYHSVKDEAFINEISPKPPLYDFRTKHAEAFGGKNGYIFSKDKVMKDILRFVKHEIIHF